MGVFIKRITEQDEAFQCSAGGLHGQLHSLCVSESKMQFYSMFQTTDFCLRSNAP